MCHYFGWPNLYFLVEYDIFLKLVAVSIVYGEKRLVNINNTIELISTKMVESVNVDDPLIYSYINT